MNTPSQPTAPAPPLERKPPVSATARSSSPATPPHARGAHAPFESRGVTCPCRGSTHPLCSLLCRHCRAALAYVSQLRFMGGLKGFDSEVIHRFKQRWHSQTTHTERGQPDRPPSRALWLGGSPVTLPPKKRRCGVSSHRLRPSGHAALPKGLLEASGDRRRAAEVSPG